MAVRFESNIPLLYFYSIFIKRVSMPIIILYFLLNNLNFTQIGILATVMAIVSLATEVHGGIFADIHGKKLSLLLHSVFGFLTMFFYFIGNSFAFFMIASVLYGLASAFITGTRQSLLYDSLIALKKTADFKKFNGRMVLYSHTVNALVLLFVPLLYVLDSKLPFLLGMIFFFVSLLIAFFFTEPDTQKEKKQIPISRRIRDSVREISIKKNILFAFLLMVLMTAFVHIASEFIQPLLQISGLSIIFFGIIYALMRVLLGFGGELTHRLEKIVKIKYLFVIGIVLFVFGFLGFFVGAGTIIIFSVLLLKFGEGLNKILLDDEINKNIKSENRTTILSISSFSSELLTALLVFSFGITADIIGVQGMFGYVLLAFVLLLALLSVIIKPFKTTQLKEKPIKN